MKLKSVWMYLAASAILLGASAARAQEYYMGREGHMMRLGDRTAQAFQSKKTGSVDSQKPVKWKKAADWQKAVQRENERFHRRAVFSVLGDNVSLSIRRNSVQAKETNKLQGIFARNPQMKRNFAALEKAVKANKLLAAYKLTVYDEKDLTYAPEENARFQQFFKGTLQPAAVSQIKHMVLAEVTLSSQHSCWFLIDAKYQIIRIYSEQTIGKIGQHLQESLS